MKPILFTSLLGLAIGAPCTTALAQDSDAANEEEASLSSEFDFSANVTLSSDYVFRGVSQTLGDPTIQGGFDISHSSGIFIGTWASNVDFSEGGPDDDQADIEVDLYAGIALPVTDDFAVDATVIYYMYPGTASGVDLDYTEFIAALHYKEYLTATFAYSGDTFATGEDGFYYKIAGAAPLPYDFTLTGAFGVYDLDKLYGETYTNWNIGLERSFGNFTAAVNYYDTDNDGQIIFGKTADSRVTVSLTAFIGG